MKTISFIECRTCGVTLFSGEKEIKILPGEEISFVTLRKEKCDFCKQNSYRTTKNKAGKRNTRHL